MAQLQSYASDLLEDAKIMARCKALNSFSFRDDINTLTELWGYCYEKICLIDPGFYSITMRLTQRLTTLPPCVRNTVRVYAARNMVDFNRRVYQEAGQNDMRSSGTFHVSGRQIYCWDATHRPVWVEYVPEPPFLTFTRNNRDPMILEEAPAIPIYNGRFGHWQIQDDPMNEANTVIDFTHRATQEIIQVDSLIRMPDWRIVSFIPDHPYLFVTYQHTAMEELHESFVINGLPLNQSDSSRFNPFDFTGRRSNVRFLTARYNDYTGLGVNIIDYNDHDRIKEVGFTPDTLIIYPSRIVYNYMVAAMAQRYAALNNSNVMAVEIALQQARDEMEDWTRVSKSAWMRANNVTGPTVSDML